MDQGQDRVAEETERAWHEDGSRRLGRVQPYPLFGLLPPYAGTTRRLPFNTGVRAGQDAAHATRSSSCYTVNSYRPRALGQSGRHSGIGPTPGRYADGGQPDPSEVKSERHRRHYREWRAKTRSEVGEACCALTVSPVLMTEASRLSRTKYASSAQVAPWVAPQ